jgi:hypothetical protein
MLTLFSSQVYVASGSGGFCTLPTLTPLGPLDSCCFTGLSVSGSGPDFPYVAMNYYYDFCPLVSSKNITIFLDAFSTNGNEIIIAAWDGSTCTTVFGSGCMTGSATWTKTIPAGTIRLVVYLVGSCNGPTGGSDLYTLTISCA